MFGQVRFVRLSHVDLPVHAWMILSSDSLFYMCCECSETDTKPEF